MTECLVCGAAETEILLDFGPQPVSSHYSASPAAEPARYPLALAACRSCGVTQLARPFPYQALVPPYDWISYREPEAHLDAVVDKIRALPGVGNHSVVSAVSYKDATTVDRLARRGAETTWTIDPRRDLAATDPNANIETVHGRLTLDAARAIAANRGLADVLVVRHIAEHAGAPARFMGALEALLAPGGYMVIEVPDCARSLEQRDYTMVWEEHSLYFTADTLPALLTVGSLQLIGIDVHPYPFEDVLVLYAQKHGGAPVRHSPVAADIFRARDYAAEFDRWTGRIRTALNELRDHGPLALYGAGHLTCAFVNLHRLADLFEFVVDDTPQKQGLHLPGCGLPIVDRAHLAESAVSACLFGLAPEIEDRVIANNRAFTARGGSFHSIFAASGRSIRRLGPIGP